MTLAPETLCKCGHAFKVHCKGNVFHANYKDSMRQMPNPRGENCVSTHCDSVLCSCISFRLCEAPDVTPTGGEA